MNRARRRGSSVIQPHRVAIATPENARSQLHVPDHQSKPLPMKNSSTEEVLSVTGPNAVVASFKPFSESSRLTKYRPVISVAASSPIRIPRPKLARPRRPKPNAPIPRQNAARAKDVPNTILRLFMPLRCSDIRAAEFVSTTPPSIRHSKDLSRTTACAVHLPYRNGING